MGRVSYPARRFRPGRCLLRARVGGMALGVTPSFLGRQTFALQVNRISSPVSSAPRRTGRARRIAWFRAVPHACQTPLHRPSENGARTAAGFPASDGLQCPGSRRTRITASRSSAATGSSFPASAGKPAKIVISIGLPYYFFTAARICFWFFRIWLSAD